MQTLGLADSTPKPTSRIRELFWPKIDNDIAAVTAGRNAMYVNFVIAALSALPAFAASGAQALSAWLNAGLYILVGIGVRQLSRTAALTGFILYGISWLLLPGIALFSPGTIVRVIATVLLLNGVRAAMFAHSAFQTDEIDSIANPRADAPGVSRASLALERAPGRIWPILRAPFFVVLTLVVALNLMSISLAAVGKLWNLPTASMETTLHAGDIIFALHRVWMGPVQRGDIVGVRYPADLSQTMIKRVVGMPGDRIKIVNKDLFINGARARDPFVEHTTDYIDAYRDNFPAVKPDAVLEGKADSMFANSVRNSEVIVPPGHYFLLGDNRDQSLDSRYWGFVADSDVIARPVLIVYSSGKDGRGLHWLPRSPM